LAHTSSKSLRGGIAAQVLALRVRPAVGEIIGVIAAGRDGDAVRPAEEPAVAVVLLDSEPALVHQPVVAVAEQEQVGEARLAARRPVRDVVRIDVAPPAAAGEAAALVAGP